MANNASNIGTIYFFMVFPVGDMNRPTLPTLKHVGLTIEVNDLTVDCANVDFSSAVWWSRSLLITNRVKCFVVITVTMKTICRIQADQYMKQRKIIIDCDPLHDPWAVTNRNQNANWLYQMDAGGIFTLLPERLDA